MQNDSPLADKNQSGNSIKITQSNPQYLIGFVIGIGVIAVSSFITSLLAVYFFDRYLERQENAYDRSLERQSTAYEKSIDTQNIILLEVLAETRAERKSIEWLRKDGEWITKKALKRGDIEIIEGIPIWDNKTKMKKNADDAKKKNKADQAQKTLRSSTLKPFEK